LIDKDPRRSIDRTKTGKTRLNDWLNRVLPYNPFMSAAMDLGSVGRGLRRQTACRQGKNLALIDKLTPNVLELIDSVRIVVFFLNRKRSAADAKHEMVYACVVF
jgi:hypothetical protein